jgi:hypothetical protein
VKVKHANLPLPEIEMIVGTRAALGMGLGFLLADKLSQLTRKQLGWALFLFGMLTTIPLRCDVFRRSSTQIIAPESGNPHIAH